MIGGAEIHTGGHALARHLLRTDDNESVSVILHGLCAEDLRGAIEELRLMGRDARTLKPLLHAWASPSVQYDDDQWDGHWSRFEDEFGLVGQPFAEVRHVKHSNGGRVAEHSHRVYPRIALNGRVIPMRNTASRAAKLSRISEFMCGEPFISGPFDRSIIARLGEGGYEAVADAMIAQGLGEHRAVSVCSSKERAAAERTGDIPVDAVKSRIFDMLQSRAQGEELVEALAAVGLRLARGAKAIVAITPAGNAIPVLRGYNQIARSRGAPTIRKADLEARLGGLALRDHALVIAEDFEHSDWIAHVGAERRDRVAIDMEVSVAPVKLDATHGDPSKDADTLGMDPASHSNGPDGLSLAALADLQIDSGREAERLADDEPVPIVPQLMTDAQQAALERWVDAMFAMEANSEPSRRNDFDLDDKVEVDVLSSRSAKGPRLETPDWKARYKAGLAGVSAELGGAIGWVDRLDDRHCRIRLRGSDIVLTGEPGRISTSSDVPMTVPIMIDFAVKQGWSEVNITGGSRQWREEMARAATRSGITVLDRDLADTVTHEQHILAIEGARTIWIDARSALAAAHADRMDIETLASRALAVSDAATALASLHPGNVLSDGDLTRLNRDIAQYAQLQAKLDRHKAQYTKPIAGGASGQGP